METTTTSEVAERDVFTGLPNVERTFDVGRYKTRKGEGVRAYEYRRIFGNYPWGRGFDWVSENNVEILSAVLPAGWYVCGISNEGDPQSNSTLALRGACLTVAQRTVIGDALTLEPVREEEVRHYPMLLEPANRLWTVSLDAAIAAGVVEFFPTATGKYGDVIDMRPRAIAGETWRD